MIVCNCLLNKDETTYNFFPMYMFACLQHMTVILFLFEFTFTASSPLGRFGRLSRRSLQLYVRALSVSLITIANISDCNLYPSATANLFAIRNGGSFSMSTGYLNLQLRPSTKVSIMSSACQSLSRRIQSNFFRRPADGLYPMTVAKYYAKSPQSSTCVPLCCLFPGYTDTRPIWQV